MTVSMNAMTTAWYNIVLSMNDLRMGGPWIGGYSRHTTLPN